jgi:hypothetical protein
MNAQATKLQTAESDLKELMADVTRAMEKAQEAVARIAPRPQPSQQRWGPRLRPASANTHDLGPLGQEPTGDKRCSGVAFSFVTLLSLSRRWYPPPRHSA